MSIPAHTFADMIGLIPGAELAEAWGYSGTNNAFRDFCAKHRITPVPGRPGWYDPHLVRRRLNEAQGLNDTAADTGRQLNLVEQRRQRRGAV